LPKVPHGMASVWVEFRKRRPELAGEPWRNDAVYTSGQQVYFVDSKEAGNFFVCQAETVAGESPESAPAKWSVVEIPYFLKGYLIQAGYADWLEADGQSSKAGVAESKAWNWLELEADKLQRQQGQVRRLNWR